MSEQQAKFSLFFITEKRDGTPNEVKTVVDCGKQRLLSNKEEVANSAVKVKSVAASVIIDATEKEKVQWWTCKMSHANKE